MPYVITSIGLASSYFFFMHAKEKAPKYKHIHKKLTRIAKKCCSIWVLHKIGAAAVAVLCSAKKTESKMKNKVNERTSECLSAVEASYVLGNAEQI